MTYTFYSDRRRTVGSEKYLNLNLSVPLGVSIRGR